MLYTVYTYQEQIDPDLEELDNVLAQLENIQTGGLMSCMLKLEYRIMTAIYYNTCIYDYVGYG